MNENAIQEGDIADKVHLTKEELEKLQTGHPVVVKYQSPIDLMIGQWETVELLILPPKGA